MQEASRFEDQFLLDREKDKVQRCIEIENSRLGLEKLQNDNLALDIADLQKLLNTALDTYSSYEKTDNPLAARFRDKVTDLQDEILADRNLIMKVARKSFFLVRYYDMQNSPITRIIPTLGYYSAELAIPAAKGEIFKTMETKHRLRMHELLKSNLDEGMKGYKWLAEFRHFLRISYNDRAEQRHTRIIEVSEMGYTDVSEAEWEQIRLDGERHILRLFAEGKDSDEVARSLGISPQTLRNHLHHINQKLRTHNRLEAVMNAIQRKLI